MCVCVWVGGWVGEGGGGEGEYAWDGGCGCV